MTRHRAESATPPRFAPGLLAGRFNVVSLANNHAMDYNAIGLQDTIAALDAAGVKHAGGGDSLEQAVQNFPTAANGALVETMQKLEDMRREQASSLIVPDAAGGFGGGGLGGGGVPGGGRIRL